MNQDAPMQRYRFVILDGNNVSVSGTDYFAATDEIAARLADGWRDRRGGQVWRDETLVKRWPPD